MKDDGSGVPSHWETTSLEEIAEVRLGRQRSPDRAHGDHMRPYMRAANVTWDGISLNDIKEMDFTPKEFEAYELRRGDILLSEASGSASEVGKPAIWMDDVPNCCFQNTLLRVRADESLARFLLLHFTKDAVTGAFAAASRGVGIHHLGAKALCEWEIRLPPLGEQDRIVEAIESYFTRLDDAVATLERVERNLKRYRASVLKSAVEGRLVPTEAALAKQERRDYEPASVLLERILTERLRHWSESGKRGKYQEPTPPDTASLPNLPEGWCWATLEQLTTLVTSGSRGWAAYYADSGPIFIRAQDIKTDRLILTHVAHVALPERAEGTRTLVEVGDVLVTITGANVTKTAIVSLDLGEAYVSQHVALCRPVLPNLSQYLHAWLVAPAAGRQVLEAAAYGAGKPGLNLDNLRELHVALPPLTEQARLVHEVDRIDSAAAEGARTATTQQVRLERLRQSILKWAFEGKLADQDPHDEPASILLERIKTERTTSKPAKASKPAKDTTPAKTPGPQRVDTKRIRA